MKLKLKTEKINSDFFQGLLIAFFASLLAFSVYMLKINSRQLKIEQILTAKVQTLERHMLNIEFVAEDLTLYQTIEGILFNKTREYSDDIEVRKIANIIYRYHKKYGTAGEIPLGLDYSLIFALIEQESNFISYAESTAGALGFVQLMPHMMSKQLEKHFSLSGLSYAEMREYAFTADVNLVCGLELLIEYQRDFISYGHASAKDWKLALSFYNWSPQAVYQLITASKRNEPKGSLKYAIEVEKLREKYEQ